MVIWKVYQKGKYYRVGIVRPHNTTRTGYALQVFDSIDWYQEKPQGIFETTLLNHAKERCDHLNDPSPWKAIEDGK